MTVIKTRKLKETLLYSFYSRVHLTVIFSTYYGTATITKSRSVIKELWQPILKTWFTEGENDPRITAIMFTPSEGYYWDTKHNMMVGIVKRAAGAIMGKTLDDSIEGNINL